LLIAHLEEINSLLDAPCGDFNRLRHCDLRLEKYVGVDVVRSIVKRNQRLCAGANRRFVAADIRTGGWRTLNFQLPPFNFPPPLHLLNENCTEAGGKFFDKSLGSGVFPI
jgi:hypothetical protein